MLSASVFTPDYIYRDLSKESGYPCFTVGFYDENGYWEPIADFDNAAKAAAKIMELASDSKRTH